LLFLVIGDCVRRFALRRIDADAAFVAVEDFEATFAPRNHEATADAAVVDADHRRDGLGGAHAAGSLARSSIRSSASTGTRSRRPILTVGISPRAAAS